MFSYCYVKIHCKDFTSFKYVFQDIQLFMEIIVILLDDKN